MKGQFISSGNRLINFKNVSLILVENKKIIVNFCHSIYLKENKSKVADYLYLDSNLKTEILDSEYIKENFIIIKDNIIINKNCVTSVKLDEPRQKIIFNFGYDVTVKAEGAYTSAGFIFIDFHNESLDINEQYNILKKKLLQVKGE